MFKLGLGPQAPPCVAGPRLASPGRRARGARPRRSLSVESRPRPGRGSPAGARGRQRPGFGPGSPSESLMTPIRLTRALLVGGWPHHGVICPDRRQSRVSEALATSSSTSSWIQPCILPGWSHGRDTARGPGADSAAPSESAAAAA